MTDFLLKDEILITPNDIITQSLKQNIVSDPTKLVQLNQKIAKMNPIEVAGDKYSFDIDSG
jgi:hypothetical protein